MNTITSVESKLANWLVKELDKRGWSQRELGRRAGIAGATVSRVIAGDQNPGWDFCAAIAKPLDKTPEEVFRLAGLLKPAEEDQGQSLAILEAAPPALPSEEHVLELFKVLESHRRRVVYDFARWQFIEQTYPANSDSVRESRLSFSDILRAMEALTPTQRKWLLLQIFPGLGNNSDPNKPPPE